MVISLSGQIEVRGKGSITRCSFRAEEIYLMLFPSVKMSYHHLVKLGSFFATDEYLKSSPVRNKVYFFSSGILGLLALQGYFRNGMINILPQIFDCIHK